MGRSLSIKTKDVEVITKFENIIEERNKDKRKGKTTFSSYVIELIKQEVERIEKSKTNVDA